MTTSVATLEPHERIALTKAPAPVTQAVADAGSRSWLDALSGGGRQRDDAVERLHALLLRAATFEVMRRRGALGGCAPRELDDLAMQAADDALMAVMGKLGSFRGESRFTTWAYKFALLEAAVKVRRRAWLNRELPLEDDGLARLPDRPADRTAGPERDAETAELLAAVRRAIDEALTPRQRAVLVAVTLNDVPIDVLAERLDATRGALYKTLHDARKKLRARLAEDGHRIDGGPEGESRE